MATEPGSQQKKKGVPWGAVFWTALGGGLLFRAFYYPQRAIVDRGYLIRCAGPTSDAKGAACSPALVVQAYPDTTIVYALASGVAILEDELAVASSTEPVVIGYGRDIKQHLVRNGEKVTIGQPIAVMGQIQLTVTELSRQPDGSVKLRTLEPSAWLAARGMKVSVNGSKPSSLWCSGGRTLVMPAATANCGLKLPAPSGLLLLPVSVTTE